MELNIKFDEKMLVAVANRVLDEYEYNGKTIREWADIISNPRTKADSVRSMSDEEMAKTFANYISCPNCPISYCKVRFTMERLGCQENWIDWMKQECE